VSYNQRGAAAAQSQTVRPMSARGWREILVCATVLAVTLRPFPALANIGLPMVAVFLPPAWFALIPIIIIESAYGVWRFRMAASPTYAAVATADCISTLIGLPVTWVVLALGQLLLFGWLPEFSMAHRFVGRDRTERALWLADMAMGPMAQFDSRLYHFQAIKWARNYPVVPGLANLYGPLDSTMPAFCMVP